MPLIPVMVNGVSAVALVDSGASISCVSKSIASKIGLESSRWGKVQSVNLIAPTKIYYTDIAIPGNITFRNMRVAEFVGGGNFDVLIGMDIITKGDLALSSANKETWLSFRVPSAQKHIDFTVA